jgi:hypothetical protein
MPGYGRRQTWGRIYLVLSLLLSVGFRDWIAHQEKIILRYERVHAPNAFNAHTEKPLLPTSSRRVHGV